MKAVSSRSKEDIFDWLVNIHFSFSAGSGAVHSASFLTSEGKSLGTNVFPLDCHSHFFPHIQTRHYQQCLPSTASVNLRGNAISYTGWSPISSKARPVSLIRVSRDMIGQWWQLQIGVFLTDV